MGCTLVVSALILQSALASPKEDFERAEVLYQNERYLEAAESYEAMRGQGLEDGALYYNLGNAYFKAGRLGRAILNYERALVLMPGDAETRANLTFANELIADTVEPSPLPLLIRWAVDFYRHLSPGIAARILSVSFLLTGVTVTLLIVDRWSGLRSFVLVSVVAFGSVSFVSGIVLATKLITVSKIVEAVVLAENAYVRSGPGDGNPRLAEIHEGLKVRVLSHREGWYQVSLANGLTGWTQQDNVETIEKTSE